MESKESENTPNSPSQPTRIDGGRADTQFPGGPGGMIGFSVMLGLRDDMTATLRQLMDSENITAANLPDQGTELARRVNELHGSEYSETTLPELRALVFDAGWAYIREKESQQPSA